MGTDITDVGSVMFKIFWERIVPRSTVIRYLPRGSSL